MENASKALIMAGSVLIALLIIGALLLMFNSLSSYQDTGTQDVKEAQIVEFNNQFETYNRTNVRGSDLYSLLNRVVDYNRRKSTSGTNAKDEGQYIAYEPMSISYDLKGKEKDLVLDKNRIFVKEYARFQLEEANTNRFERYIDSKINDVQDIAINENAMQNLASGVSNLFDKNNEKDVLTAIQLWNTNAKTQIQIQTDSGKNREQYNQVINTEQNKEKIYTYYEFMQFKRARFKCTGVTYNKKTGRITQMSFEYTEKME